VAPGNIFTNTEEYDKVEKGDPEIYIVETENKGMFKEQVNQDQNVDLIEDFVEFYQESSINEESCLEINDHIIEEKIDDMFEIRQLSSEVENKNVREKKNTIQYLRMKT